MATVLEWGVEDVAQWVEQCLLLPYGEAFRRGNVDGTALVDLHERGLSELGVQSAPHVIRLLSHIAVFRVQLGRTPVPLDPSCWGSGGSGGSGSGLSSGAPSVGVLLPPPTVARSSSPAPAAGGVAVAAIAGGSSASTAAASSDVAAAASAGAPVPRANARTGRPSASASAAGGTARAPEVPPLNLFTGLSAAKTAPSGASGAWSARSARSSNQGEKTGAASARGFAWEEPGGPAGGAAASTAPRPRSGAGGSATSGGSCGSKAPRPSGPNGTPLPQRRSPGSLTTRPGAARPQQQQPSTSSRPSSAASSRAPSRSGSAAPSPRPSPRPTLRPKPSPRPTRASREDAAGGAAGQAAASAVAAARKSAAACLDRPSPPPVPSPMPVPAAGGCIVPPSPRSVSSTADGLSPRGGSASGSAGCFYPRPRSSSGRRTPGDGSASALSATSIGLSSEPTVYSLFGADPRRGSTFSRSRRTEESKPSPGPGVYAHAEFTPRGAASFGRKDRWTLEGSALLGKESPGVGTYSPGEGPPVRKSCGGFTTAARTSATWLWEPDARSPGPMSYSPRHHVLSTFKSK
eukprot:TRINITY_DN4610_c0_g1_i2.p1 TRINITY_DN4610_c0_g1~~TRINITY_DN4610_c0_g1_i2.p1  ORF type:complete len:576 (+),score=107.20 TRINITY_DN4610_c0_g1_i2:240-1967(+)